MRLSCWSGLRPLPPPRHWRPLRVRQRINARCVAVSRFAATCRHGAGHVGRHFDRGGEAQALNLRQNGCRLQEQQGAGARMEGSRTSGGHAR
jgi:hypothetical protein